MQVSKHFGNAGDVGFETESLADTFEFVLVIGLAGPDEGEEERHR